MTEAKIRNASSNLKLLAGTAAGRILAVCAMLIFLPGCPPTNTRDPIYVPTPPRTVKLESACLAISEVTDETLSGLQISPLQWRIGEQAAETAIKGKPGHLLVLALSKYIDSHKVALMSDNGEITRKDCGLYELDSGEHRLSIPWSSQGPPDDDSVRAYLLMEPEFRADHLQKIYDTIRPPSFWSEEDSLDQFKKIGAKLENLLLHAKGQSIVEEAGLRLTNNAGLALTGDAKMLDQETLRRNLNNSLGQLLVLEGRPTDFFLEVSRVYHNLGAGSGRLFALVRERLKQLEARALVEHLDKSVDELPGEASRSAARSIDGLLEEINSSDTQDACKLSKFPSQKAIEALKTMIQISTDYADEDFCDQKTSHRDRLKALSAIVSSLEKKCWLGKAANRDQLIESIAKVQKRVEQSIALQNGALPPEIKAWQKELDEAAATVAQVLVNFDTAIVAGSRDKLALHRYEMPDFGPDCDGTVTPRVKAELEKLTQSRDLLLADLDWFRDLPLQPWIRARRLPSCTDMSGVTNESKDRKKVWCSMVRRSSLNIGCDSKEAMTRYLQCAYQPCPSVVERLEPILQSCWSTTLRGSAERDLARYAAKGTCQACAEMDKLMEDLRRSPDSWKNDLATELTGAYISSRRRAADDLFSEQPQRCEREAIDPRPPGTIECCGLDATEINRRIDEKLENCCDVLINEWQAELADLAQNLVRLENLSQLTWSEFETASLAVGKALESLPAKGRNLGECQNVGSDPLSSQRATWNRLLKNGGILQSLADLLRDQDLRVLSDSPRSRQILDWSASIKDHYTGGDAWHLLLKIADHVRVINRDCPDDSSERPDPHVRERYKELVQDRNQLAALSVENLNREAQTISQQADECLDRHKDRSFEIKLDRNGTFTGNISPEDYGLTGSGGRLIQLQFDGSKATRVRGLSSLTVEIYTRGFAVSPRDSEGLADASSRRHFVKEVSPLIGYETVYRSHEELTDNPSASEAFFFIEPAGGKAPGEIHLRVVPRAF